MTLSWEKAVFLGRRITPVLFINRRLGTNKAKRSFGGKVYTAYPIEQFFSLIKSMLSTQQNGDNICFDDDNLKTQWEEMCASIETSDINIAVDFINEFEFHENQLDLDETEKKLIKGISNTFSCSDVLATELFIRLVVALRRWTTTRRTTEKVTLEDVYTALSIKGDIDTSQHRLAPPFPFFESRYAFCTHLEKRLRDVDKKVVFISENPGAGKTSTLPKLKFRV